MTPLDALMQNAEVPRGTYECRFCGQATPHYHPPDALPRLLAIQESRKRYESWLMVENTERDDVDGLLIGNQYPNWAALCHGFNHADPGLEPSLERRKADAKYLAEYHYYVTECGWKLWQYLESVVTRLNVARLREEATRGTDQPRTGWNQAADFLESLR